MRGKIILSIFVFMIIILQGCSDSNKISDNTESDVIISTECIESSTEIESITTECTELSTETQDERITTEYEEPSTDVDAVSEPANDWYKQYMYFMGDENKLELCYLDGDIVQVIVDDVYLFDFDANNYIIDEFDGYVYKDEINEAELTYYPEDNSIIVINDDKSSFYCAVDEDTYYAVSEDNNYVEGNSTNNFTDEEIYQAASYYMWDAIQNSAYAGYDWEYVKNVSVSPYIGGGYTATFYIHSNTLHAYKYLRVNIGVGPSGFYYIGGGM